MTALAQARTRDRPADGDGRHIVIVLNDVDPGVRRYADLISAGAVPLLEANEAGKRGGVIRSASRCPWKLRIRQRRQFHIHCSRWRLADTGPGDEPGRGGPRRTGVVVRGRPRELVRSPRPSGTAWNGHRTSEGNDKNATAAQRSAPRLPIPSPGEVGGLGTAEGKIDRFELRESFRRITRSFTFASDRAGPELRLSLPLVHGDVKRVSVRRAEATLFAHRGSDSFV